MEAAPRIAIDAMGGDAGPAAMIAGLAKSYRRDSTLRFLVFGDERLINPELKKHDRASGAVEVVHTPEAIAATEKPSQSPAKTAKIDWYDSPAARIGPRRS